MVTKHAEEKAYFSLQWRVLRHFITLVENHAICFAFFPTLMGCHLWLASCPVCCTTHHC